jgi:hypothetical protein
MLVYKFLTHGQPQSGAVSGSAEACIKNARNIFVADPTSAIRDFDHRNIPIGSKIASHCQFDCATLVRMPKCVQREIEYHLLQFAGICGNLLFSEFVDEVKRDSGLLGEWLNKLH